MNFTNMRLKRSESNSIMDFKRDVFWIQQAKNQEERPRESYGKIGKSIQPTISKPRILNQDSFHTIQDIQRTHPTFQKSLTSFYHTPASIGTR
ncbi:unnamed protein product [Brassica rapa]|uniref:Uncharacterized protein n=1 Tax=Brassica campestris TaxID=3711 RepID=A0A3P6B5A9_BRACM|nr:unnamed protein product [Brassica rapa]VDC97405.1 unnamed protein product [Brassica rapa]